MDTRQLSAFVAVVELRSFSQAATRLGVTQPAVSLQIRSLEQRLGQRLVDRSGRRVEPTEAGERLYQSAKRMLQIEEELLAGLAEAETGELSGALRLGASTGPGGAVVPVLLCAFQQANPGVTVSLIVHDTQTVVELVAARELELGIVGASRRQRGVAFEPLFTDEVILATPPGHLFAGKSVTLDELRAVPLILMQEGAGVRQVTDDELRWAGVTLRARHAPRRAGRARVLPRVRTLGGARPGERPVVRASVRRSAGGRARCRPRGGPPRARRRLDDRHGERSLGGDRPPARLRAHDV